jgi:hypothetical protein
VIEAETNPDSEENELEIPDVFDLRPISTQQITLIIREIRPARFYYVPDEDDLDEQTDDNVKI